MDRYDPYTDKFLRDTQYNIHGTNLAEVGTDAISRQSVIDMLDETKRIARQNIDGAVLMTFESVFDSLVNITNALPTIQPEIIRCKDCLMHGVCRFEQGLGLDGYCSQAERSTDG